VRNIQASFWLILKEPSGQSGPFGGLDTLSIKNMLRYKVADLVLYTTSSSVIPALGEKQYITAAAIFTIALFY
jgi:hypothetical protein